ncbi:DnaJ subfamily B protein [Phytophthora megakarya]|uniref:DnaJ subfamily B protein n=1 Tax=Phytophthora megakarya TaxID=4795 RepID=A0A225X3D8_9STRA|nr:DnaJ subfamily B protein [Phytophthora megakarya]
MEKHYDILQVPRNASAQEIKKAFRILALRWHPDKHQQNGISTEEAKQRFHQVKTSYEVLMAVHERGKLRRGGQRKSTHCAVDEMRATRWFQDAVTVTEYELQKLVQHSDRQHRQLQRDYEEILRVFQRKKKEIDRQFLRGMDELHRERHRVMRSSKNKHSEHK